GGGGDGAPPPGPGHERPGSAQPRARRARTAAARRRFRLGRRIAADDRLHQSGGALAGTARAAPPHRGRRTSARRAAAGLSGAPARTPRILRSARAPRRGRPGRRGRLGARRATAMGSEGDDRMIERLLARTSPGVATVLDSALEGRELSESDAIALLGAQGSDLHALLQTADAARALDKGDDVSFVICRNINFTNVCYVGCTFCGFSRHEDEADAYDHPMEKLIAKARDAVARGATEVCIQGGIHPRKDHTHDRDTLAAPTREVP